MKRSFNVPFKNFSNVFPNVAYVLPGWNTLSNSMLNHMTETSLSISCCGRWAIFSLLQELVKDPVELGGSNPVFLISINFSSYQLKFRKPFHNRLTSSGETRFFGIGGETSFFVQWRNNFFDIGETSFFLYWYYSLFFIVRITILIICSQKERKSLCLYLKGCHFQLFQT